MDKEDINILKKAEKIADEKYDGHYTLMKFTTNYRFGFGTMTDDAVRPIKNGTIDHNRLDNIFPSDKCFYEAIHKAIINEEKIDKEENEIEKDFEKDLLFLTEEYPKYKKTEMINNFKRDRRLIYELKRKYNKCMICKFTFKKKNGENYNEAHHIIPLSKNGKDVEINTLILCANCHAQMHHADVDILKIMQNIVIINGEEKQINRDKQ